MPLHWLLWVIAYIIIIAGVAWTVLPEKPLWLMLTIAIVIAGCVWLLKHWPDRWSKEDAKKEGK